jgi:cytochrome c553
MTKTATAFAAAALLLLGGHGATAADAAAGKQKAQLCATCHGIDGAAKQPDAPNIGGESAIYLERQLKAFRSGERQHEQMSVIAQGLSDEDIADLVAWYSSIKFSVEMPQ